MLNLYLLRHGETEFSRQDRFCGQIDAELTERGHQMASAFAEAHDNLSWRAIYTSTRERAIKTAVPLATRTATPITAVAALDEIDFGDWQGQSKQEIAARDAAAFARWSADPSRGAPRGESVYDVAKRAMAAIDTIRASHDDGNVLIVAHKTVLRVLICLLTGTDLRCYRDLPQPVAAVTVVELCNGVSTLRQLADNSYLPAHLHDADAEPVRVAASAATSSHRPAFEQPQAAA